MTILKIRHFNDFELKHMLGGKYLELLVNTINGEVIHVDPGLGHIRTAAEYLKTPVDEIDETNAHHLVSVVVTIENKVVKEIGIGRSSLELGPRMHHSRTELKRAKKIMERMMRFSRQLGEVKIIDDIRKHEFVFH